MNQTEYYQLSLWDAEDRIQRTDFNADNAKLEEALTDHAEAIAGFGNCQIYTTTYTGTGGCDTAGACRLTFPRPPLLIVVSGGDSFGLCVGQGTMFSVFMTVMLPCTTAWSEDRKTLAWHRSSPSDQMNTSGVTYRVTALMAADQ